MNDLHLRHENAPRMPQAQRDMPVVKNRQLPASRAQEHLVTVQQPAQFSQGGGGADVNGVRAAFYGELHREQALRTRSTWRQRTLRL